MIAEMLIRQAENAEQRALSISTGWRRQALLAAADELRKMAAEYHDKGKIE